MKKTLTVTTMTLLAGGVSVYAQGQISLADISPPPGIQIFAAQSTGNNTTVSWGGHSGSELMGNSGNTASYGAYNGTTGSKVNFTGAPLSSGNVELLYGPSSDTSVSQLLESGNNFATTWYGGDPIAGLGGFWSGAPTVTLPNGYPFGGTAVVAIAAWVGSATSLALAQSEGEPWGVSNLGSLTGVLGGGQYTPPSVEGLESFSLVYSAPVPEPSTIALGVMGASALLFRRRK